MNIPDKKVRKCCEKCSIYGGLTNTFLQCGNRVCKCHAPAVEVSKCCGADKEVKQCQCGICDKPMPYCSKCDAPFVAVEEGCVQCGKKICPHTSGSKLKIEVGNRDFLAVEEKKEGYCERCKNGGKVGIPMTGCCNGCDCHKSPVQELSKCCSAIPEKLCASCSEPFKAQDQNQCDGCMMGYPLEGDYHLKDGRVYSICQKGKYNNLAVEGKEGECKNKSEGCNHMAAENSEYCLSCQIKEEDGKCKMKVWHGDCVKCEGKVYSGSGESNQECNIEGCKGYPKNHTHHFSNASSKKEHDKEDTKGGTCSKCGVWKGGDYGVDGNGKQSYHECAKKEEQGDWEEELYFGVLEDLLFHQKMLPHHRNQKEGMDEIRQDIEKLKDFIRHQLQTARQDTMNEIIEICREIYIDDADWSEWGISDERAGETFDEHLAEKLKGK